VLYRRGDKTITRDHLKALVDSGVTTLFIKTTAQGAYRRYLEEHLDSFLADAASDAAKKAEIVYEAATGLVEDILRDPNSRESIQRTQHLVTATVNYIIAERDALQNLVANMATDYSTYTHSVDVCVYAISLGKRLDMARPALNDLAVGALLHDVGKTRVPTEILHKKGPLTETEFAVVKKHPEMGIEILSEGPRLPEAVYKIVLSHHEKVNGSGYPQGIKGRHIAPQAKMTCIIDIFDAMTTNRSYRRAMSFFDALRLMRDEMLDHFEPDLWESFVLMLGHQE